MKATLTTFVLLALICGLYAFDIKLPTDTHSFRSKGRSFRNGAGCESCKFVVDIIKMNIGSEVSIKERMNSVCTSLPAKYIDKCREKIDKHLEEIIEMISMSEPSEEICKKISFCKPRHHRGKFSHQRDINTCAACEFFTGAIINQLGGEKNPTRIVQKLEESCNNVPKLFVSQCRSFVNQHKPQLIKFLESGTSPTQICRGLHLCSNKAETTQSEEKRWSSKDGKSKWTSSYTSTTKTETVSHSVSYDTNELQARPDCDFCVFTLWTIQLQLNNNETVANIVKTLNTVCETLPFGQGECKEMIQQYFPLLLQYLLAKETPRQICTHLGQCDESAFMKKLINEAVEFNQEKLVHHKRAASSNLLQKQDDLNALSFKCDICEYIFELIYKEMGSNTTQHHIKNVLDKICNMLPFGKTICIDMVDEFLPFLIKYLQQQLPPNKICQNINLCSNGTSTYEQLRAFLIVREYAKNNPFNPNPHISSTGCQLCQWVASAVGSWLSEGSTQNQIANLLAQICNFFNEYAQQCDQLIQVYTPKFIEELVESQSPPIVCSQLGVCNH